jgi:hypothetical protein
MRLQLHWENINSNILLIFFIFLISESFSSTEDLTNISSCICSESSSFCISSATCPKNIHFYVDFNSHSPVDKYSKAWISEENITTGFGRRNQGKSIKLAPSSNVQINSLEKFQGEGFSVMFWIRMQGKTPYTFSSILSISLNKSPFPSDNDKGIFFEIISNIKRIISHSYLINLKRN